MRILRAVAPLLAAAVLAACDARSATLAHGAPAPDFALPGVDGAIHRLAEYASSPVLAVVFTCNHCPAAQQYEQRIEKLFEDYRGRGVALVAINPNQPAALTPNDLRYSDVNDDLDGMKARAALRHLTYPYLYAGDAPAIAAAFKVVATPQIFIFDRARTLAYTGQIDDSVVEPKVKLRYAREAIDDLLRATGGAVTRDSVIETSVDGCPLALAPAHAAADARPVAVEMATADVLRTLRANATGKLLVVNFWATWCGPCAVEFPDLVMTDRMYRSRNVEFVNVSENDPAERAQVLDFLGRHDSHGRNLLFATPHPDDMQNAFDPAMPAAVPFTLVLGPGGDVLYQELGMLDVLKLRRAILANLPDDQESPGTRSYWAK